VRLIKRAFWLSLWLVSCQRQIPLPTYDQGLDLFPIAEGRTWVYLVQETTYTTTGAVPFRYWLRVRIDTPTVDAYGRPSHYMIWDTASFLDSSRWGFYRVGLIYRDDRQGEIWENNTRLLMLRFPLSPEIRWNRYEYAGNPAEICRYAALDTNWRIGNRSSPRCAWVVRRADTTALLERALFYEVYERGQGLVHRYERLDRFNLENNGALLRSTDSYHREYIVFSR